MAGRFAPPSPTGHVGDPHRLAAALLTANWTAYVYAVVHERVIETALGYFMAPLGTMVLGIIVLKERPSAAQKVAIVLAAVAVVELTLSYGRPPIAALVMAVSWSVYGLLKRRVPLAAVDRFAAESFVLVIPALIVVAVTAGVSDSIPRTATAAELALVSLSGVATAVPLILFAFAAARVPFTLLGPLQYLVPTINFLLGWALYDEELPVDSPRRLRARLGGAADHHRRRRAQHRRSPGRLPRLRPCPPISPSALSLDHRACPRPRLIRCAD